MPVWMWAGCECLSIFLFQDNQSRGKNNQTERGGKKKQNNEEWHKNISVGVLRLSTVCAATRKVIWLPLMSTDISGTKTAWMGSMRSKQHYDVELNVTMGGGEGGRQIGIYFYGGSTLRHLTLMDNLSLIAGLAIYGVESITHAYTYIMH